MLSHWCTNNGIFRKVIMTQNLILRIISTLQKVVSSRANYVMDPFGDTVIVITIENNTEFKMAAILPESPLIGRI